MKISGIYQIQSKVKPERIYIGSAIDIKHRWYLHLWQLKQGIHHSIKLQRHYNKYGESDLQFSLLCECSKDYLLKTEQNFLNTNYTYFNNYKIVGSPLGCKRTKKMILDRSKLFKGRHFSKGTEFKKGHIPIHAGTKGLRPSSQKGITRSKEVKRNMSEGMKIWWRNRKSIKKVA
jgi:group I intron endonuclease